MSKISRNNTIGIIILVLALSGSVWFFLQNSDDSKENNTAPTQAATPVQASTEEETTEEATVATPGRYAQYSQEALTTNGYNTNVVFFYAPWCPECRAFKQAITSADIPAGTQILEADYDSSTDLRKQYGVTLQSTFVRVSSEGTLQKKWVGYGKDKSIQTVLENVK